MINKVISYKSNAGIAEITIQLTAPQKYVDRIYNYVNEVIDPLLEKENKNLPNGR